MAISFDRIADIYDKTRRLLVSVVHEGKTPASEEYRKFLIGCGWKFPQLGIAEHELVAMVEPDKSIDIATYDANIEQSLTFLEKKAYSYQWGIPEELHRRVMQQLKTMAFPKAYSEKVEVLVWDIKNIWNFAKSCKD